MSREPGAFGLALRAARLGWGFSARHSAYIRLSDAGPENTHVEVVRVGPGAVQALTCDARPKDERMHRAWWTVPGMEVDALLDLCAPLGVFLTESAPVGYWHTVVDGDGRELGCP